MIKILWITLVLSHIVYGNSIDSLKKVKDYQTPYREILAYANQFLGYSYGASKKKNQVDCSRFVQEVFIHFGIFLPRSVSEQAHVGKYVDFKNIQEGDLLFFYRESKYNPSHVAIYVGHGKIIHASYIAKSVHYDSLDKAFFRKHFLFAKRITISEKYKINSADNSTLPHLKIVQSPLKKQNNIVAKTENLTNNLESTRNICFKESRAFPPIKFRNYQIFEGRDVIISNEGKEHLQKWVQLFKLSKYKSIIVNVYTDDAPPIYLQARFATNLVLSQARAKLIADYLIMQGINPKKIKAQGFGDMDPVASNDSEEGRSKNRRIEFILSDENE